MNQQGSSKELVKESPPHLARGQQAAHPVLNLGGGDIVAGGDHAALVQPAAAGRGQGRGGRVQERLAASFSKGLRGLEGGGGEAGSAWGA